MKLFVTYIKTLVKTTAKNARKALFALIICLIISAIATLFTHSRNEMILINELNFQCKDLQTKIELRLHAHAQLLRNGSGLFAASDSVSREEWKIFHSQSKIDQYLSVIQGVGYSTIISKNNLQAHITKMRKEGFSNYSIKPAGVRDIYTSILYIEPFSGRNLRAFGYDMFSESTRRKAMELARDSDFAALSGKVTLVQETNKDVQAGVLIYVPVYTNGMPVNTAEQRRKAIKGWVYSPYRMNDLMSGILGRNNLNNDKTIHLQIYDGSISKNNLLFDSQRNDTINHIDELPRTVSLPINFNGTKWILNFTQSTSQVIFFTNMVILVFVGCLIISLLVTFLFLTLLNTRTNALIIAERLTSEIKGNEIQLKEQNDEYQQLNEELNQSNEYLEVSKERAEESEKILEMLLKNSPIVIYLKDENLRMVRVSDTFQALSGNEMNEILGKTNQEIWDEQFANSFDENDHQILKENKTMEVEEELNGRFYASIKFPIQIEGKPRYIAGFSIDNTDQRKAQEMLEENHKMMSQFIEHSPIYAFIKEVTPTESRVMMASKNYKDMIGIEGSDMIGKTMYDLFPEEYAAIFTADDWEVASKSVILNQNEYFNMRQYNTIKFPIFHLGKNLLAGYTIDITQMKEAEEVLRESEGRFKNMFAHHNSIMLLVEPESGQIMDANQSASNFYGYPISVLTSMLITEINTLSPEQTAKERLEAQLENRNYFIFTHRLATGEERFVEVHSSPIDYHGRKILFSIIHDITERKKAEKKLKYWEEIFTHAKWGVTIGSADGKRFELVNQEFAVMHGYSAEELYSMATKMVFAPECRAEVPSIIKTAHQKGHHVVESVHIRKDGSKFPVLMDITAVNNENGEPLYRIINVQDISVQKEAEKALKESEKKFRLMIKNSNDTFVLMNENAEQIFVSDAAQVVTGYTNDEVLGAFANLIHPDDLPIVLERWASIIQNKEIAGRVQYRHKHKEKGWVWLEAVAQNFLDNPAIKAVVANVRDISINKEAELKLKERELKLIELNATKDKFFSIIAHDLKNPFSSIMGASEILMNYMPKLSEEKKMSSVKRINISALSAYKLLENLLDWAQSQTGQIEFKPELQNLKDIFTNTQNITASNSLAKNIEVNIEVADELQIIADKNMINTILRNLVSNSIKYTPRNGKIKITAQENERYVLISVIDNGIGMSKEKVAMLFDISAKTSTPGTDNEKGTGLGLLLCKEFVEKHGGKIWVESKELKGSEFKFTVPK